MFTNAALRRHITRAAKFEQMEGRCLLSSQPCLFDVPDQGLATRAVEAVNCFGADVYSQLQQSEGNLFFSPLSVSTALAMTYAGAAGHGNSPFGRTTNAYRRSMRTIHSTSSSGTT